MSPRMRKFLTEWLEWVKEGAPTDHPHFKRASGLCYNLGHYYNNRFDLDEELEALLPSPTMYPFGGHAVYQHEWFHRTAYQNQQRLDWVREILEKTNDE